MGYTNTIYTIYKGSTTGSPDKHCDHIKSEKKVYRQIKFTDMCVMACYTVLCGLVAFGDVLRELQPKRLSPENYPYKIKETLIKETPLFCKPRVIYG